MKKKLKAVFVCAAVLSGLVLFAGCPQKKSGAQEILDAAKNLGKTIEKNAPAVLEDMGKAAKTVKKAAEGDAVKDAAKDAVDAAGKIIKQAIDD
ncbi:hypothetical protein FACS1894110_09330 [Spirochaetia bacterium]|nr:hypothetical protein FACS1894110_09330 [Spirochaetia bacterium]